MQDSSHRHFQSHQMSKLNLLQRYLLTKNKIYRKTCKQSHRDASLISEQRRPSKLLKITADTVFSKRQKYLSGSVQGLIERHPFDQWNRQLEKTKPSQRNNESAIDMLLSDMIKNKKQNLQLHRRNTEEDEKSVQVKHSHLKYNLFRKDELDNWQKAKSNRPHDCTILKVADLQRMILTSKRSHKKTPLHDVDKQNSQQTNLIIQNAQSIQNKLVLTSQIDKPNSKQHQNLSMRSNDSADAFNFHQNQTKQKHTYSKKCLNTTQIIVTSLNLDAVKIKKQNLHNRSDIYIRTKLAQIASSAPFRKLQSEEIKVQPWNTFQKTNDEKAEMILQ